MRKVVITIGILTLCAFTAHAQTNAEVQQASSSRDAVLTPASAVPTVASDSAHATSATKSAPDPNGQAPVNTQEPSGQPASSGRKPD